MIRRLPRSALVPYTTLFRSDAGLAGQEHDLAVARLGQLPAVEQQRDLLVPADEGLRPAPRVRRLEAGRRGPLAYHAPRSEEHTSELQSPPISRMPSSA